MKIRSGFVMIQKMGTFVGKQLKISYGVILYVAVNMMYNFSRIKISSDMFFYNYMTFKNIPCFCRKWMVRFKYIFISIHKSATFKIRSLMSFEGSANFLTMFFRVFSSLGCKSFTFPRTIFSLSLFKSAWISDKLFFTYCTGYNHNTPSCTVIVTTLGVDVN